MISIDQYKGCFLGLAVGDAFGARHEGGPLERLAWRVIGKTTYGKLRYTDDTQMAIDLAESFLQCGEINQNHLASTFAYSYQWSRGYGPSTSQILKLIKNGGSWATANKKKFKAGSYGNGAAMRSPILAMCYPSNATALLENAIKSAEITHAHPLGIEGAKLIAIATHGALRRLSNQAILTELLSQCNTKDFRDRVIFCSEALNKKSVKPSQIRIRLGNGIEATKSCVTAIYLALKLRHEKPDTILAQTVALGGDTDTIGAMAGSIWGALNGSQDLDHLAKHIEDWEKIVILSEALFEKSHPKGPQAL